MKPFAITRHLMLALLLLAGVHASAAPKHNDLSAFGAVCDGTTSDNTAIANAVAAANTNGWPIYVPPGKGCVYSTTMTFTKLVPIVGEGPGLSRLIYTGTGNGMTFVVPAPTDGIGDNNRGHSIRGVHLKHQQKGGGQIGIHIYLPAGRYYNYFDISDIVVEDFGTLGLFLDNTALNGDGIFNGRIQNSLIYNGIKAVGLGDAVWFDRVTASGKNNVYLEGLNEARQVAFHGGSISTTAGLLVLKNLHGFRAQDVWFEVQAPCTVGCVAAVSLVDSFDTVIERSTFNLRPPGGQIAHQYAVSVAGGRDTKLINNTFGNKGTAGHIYVAASSAPSKRTRIEGNVYSMDGLTLDAPVITFAPGSN